ncbi:hypothetical protein C8J55DRAFT_226087 [Lentinula edodes]|uniref:F-box domain-containing protein n=1 Tax=Lentinula lateritia TaxID=40482 RepID=A0A9W8ZVY6_9AGAR|nr:hypothetical protein C8J55DRAFT_226087 [Lentinula edodes]
MPPKRTKQAKGKRIQRTPKICHINRLSNDLLLEILRHFCDSRTAERFKRTCSYPDFDANFLAVSFVNKRWRSIILATPSLWGKIYVAMDSISPEKTPPFINSLIDLYLERSKGAALDICVLYSDYGVEDEDYNSEQEGEEGGNAGLLFPVLPKLFQHACRWRSAVLRLPQSSVLDSMRIPSDFPVLQKLDIQCVPAPDMDAGTTSFPGFLSPLLRKLSVTKFAFEGDFGSTCLDDISLTWVTPATAVDFFENASTKCTANIHTLFSPYRYFGSSHVTSKLMALTVTATREENMAPDPLGNLLDCLTLPNVEKLTFVDERDNSYNTLSQSWLFPTKSLLSLFDRSLLTTTNLTYLHFAGRYISDSDLMKILDRLPALKHLVFKEASPKKDESNPLTEHFFQSFVARYNPVKDHSNDVGISAPFLPDLTHIELGFNSKSFPSIALAEFIKSRLPPLSEDVGQSDPLPQNGISNWNIVSVQIYELMQGALQLADALKQSLSKYRSGKAVIEITAEHYDECGSEYSATVY